MRRLSSLGSKQLAHRKGRSALTATGILLGVAIMFGVLVSNATTQSGVDSLVKDYTGLADVLVRPTGAFDAHLPASILARLRALPHVRVAVGSLRLDSAIRLPRRRDPIAVEVRGIDLESAARIQNYTLLGGRFFTPGAREAVIPDRLRRRLKIAIGATVRVGTPHGVEPLLLVGILKDAGAGRTNQGDEVFTSLADARALDRVGEVISGARLVLDGGTDVDAWIKRYRRAVGPGLQFDNADSLAKGFKDFLSILGSVFTFFAAITLFVGAFLIFLTLSMAVIERVRVYGTMRALGATRAQVRRTVIAEALVLGAFSTIAGLALGLLIARGLLALISALFEFDLPGLTVTPGAVIAGVLVGMVTTLIASLIPARRASRLSPVVAMRGDYASETRLSRFWILGAVFVLFGTSIAGFAGKGSGAYGAPLIMLGAVLLTPLLLRPLARVLGRMTQRMARGVGDVSVLHLVKERSRSAYTLAMIMVVMAVIFAVGGLNVTLLRAANDSLDRQFGADIQIHPVSFRGLPTVDSSFDRALRTIPGVGKFTAIRFGQVHILKTHGNESEAFARIIDPSTYFAVQSFAFKHGNDRAAERALRAGGAVVLPADIVRTLNVDVGDTVRIRTVRGVERFRVAATFASFAGPPEVVFGLADGKRSLAAGDASVYSVNVTPGSDVQRVRNAIDATLGARYNIKTDTAGSLKDDARRQFSRFFNIFYAILLVAAIVGLLGLANTLAMSVIQRYREIGILRAIGTTRGQVRRMVFVESATLASVAFVLAIPLGLFLSVLTVWAMGNAFGFDVPYVYPSTWVAVLLIFDIAVAVVAAIAPGRRAARLEVVSALQYE